jgi:hypothetical protein
LILFIFSISSVFVVVEDEPVKHVRLDPLGTAAPLDFARALEWEVLLSGNGNGQILIREFKSI